jgi:hypothetical protein
MQVKYEIKQDSNGSFLLYYGSHLLTTFTRQNFREKLEVCASNWGLSSDWIGSILRLLNEKFPVPYPKESDRRSDLQRLIDRIGIEGLASHYRSKGLRVTKKLKISDREAVRALEKEGYQISGLINDVYYESPERLLEVS